ncbi:hypothetical protein AB5I41_10905 [Sphingomonas sp. MMS24-JH45]
MDTIGFLMMSHMVDPETLAGQAKLMESYGATCVYVTDSGGALDMDGYRARLLAYDRVLKPDGARHPCASQSVAGCRQFDRRRAARRGADRRQPGGNGRGSWQHSVEAFVAAADRKGWKHGCDLYVLMDAAEELVRPLQVRPVRVDRETPAVGDAGVYSSFLRYAERASADYGVDTRAILVELAAAAWSAVRRT